MEVSIVNLKALIQHNMSIKKSQWASSLYFKLEAKGNTLKISVFTHSDAHSDITSFKKSCDVVEAGACLVDAKKFASIVNKFSDDTKFTVTATENKVALSTDEARFELSTRDADSFINLEHDGDDYKFEFDPNILNKVDYCMAKKDVRYFLNGMNFKSEAGKLHTVATDGHRMSLHTIESSCKHKFNVIVNHETIAKVKKYMTGPISASVYDTTIIFSSLNCEIEAKLIDGRYPDFERVIPKNNNKELVVNKKQLKDSIGIASVLSNEKYRSVKLTLTQNKLELSANNPEQETAAIKMPCQYNDESLEIGYNSDYLLQTIGKISSDTIYMYLNDSHSSLLIKDGENQHIIVPTRL